MEEAKRAIQWERDTIRKVLSELVKRQSPDGTFNRKTYLEAVQSRPLPESSYPESRWQKNRILRESWHPSEGLGGPGMLFVKRVPVAHSSSTAISHRSLDLGRQPTTDSRVQSQPISC